MPIPNVASRPCETLVHLFPVPSSHSRNFIRENKKSIREKSKQQTNFTAAQIATQARQNGAEGRLPPRSIGITESMEENLPKVNMKTYNWQQKARVQSGEKLRQKTSPKVAAQRRATIPTPVPIARTQSVAIQTDEIKDELYLYSALKKCASASFKNALRTKFLQKDEEEKQKSQLKNKSLEKETKSTEKNPTSNFTQNSPEQVKTAEKAIGPRRNSIKNAFENPRMESPRNTHSTLAEEHVHPASAEVNDQFNVMSLPPEMKSKCTKGTCTNCPEGYHLLTEEERELIKSKLLERERLFIKQLNSFPLAIETLRVRQCKTRIERELSALEQNLRKLTKRKVYAKINE